MRALLASIHPSRRPPPFGPPSRKRSRYEHGPPPRYRSRRAQKSITVLSEVIERAPLALFDTYRRCPGDFGSPTCSLFIYFYSDIRKEKPILKKLFLILLRLGFFICRLTCGRLNSRYDVKIIFFFIYGLSLN